MGGSAPGRDKWGNPKWGGISPASTTYIWGTVSLSISPIPSADFDYGTGLGGGRRSEPSDVASIEIPYDTLAPGAPSISVDSAAGALVLHLTPPDKNTDGTDCVDFKEFEVFYSSSSGIDPSDPTTYDGSFKTPAHEYTFATEEKTYFVARAWDQDGNYGPISSEVCGTPVKPTGAIDDYPSNIKQVIVGLGMIGIEFQPPKSSWFRWAGYKLYYQYDDGSGWNGTWQMIYQGPGPGFLHKGLNENYKYKYKCTVVSEDGSETSGTISDNGGAGYQPNASDNSNLLSETIFAERIIATKEILSRTLIGGTLRSLNWTSSAGTEVSLDDEVLRMGGSGVGFLSGKGIWLGKSGDDYKLFVGDSSSHYLAWNGSSLHVEGVLIARSGSSIDGEYLIDLSVGTAKLKDLSVTTAKIADAAITTAKIEDLAVTSAKISDLTFDKITAGTNTASLVIGSSGYIKSQNYSAGSSGFIIKGSGDAEFNDVTVRGAIITSSGSQLNADYLTAGTITGRTIKTKSSGAFLELYGDDKTGSLMVGGDGAGDTTIFIDASNGDIRGRIFRAEGVSKAECYNLHLNSSVTGRFVYASNNNFSGNAPTSWTDLDLSPTVGSQRALVLLRIENNSTNAVNVRFRPNGESWFIHQYADQFPGAFSTRIPATGVGLVWALTDSSGKVEWCADVAADVDLYVQSYFV